jgi:hypothetical protein
LIYTKQGIPSQGGSKSILKYATDPISASLFTRPVNLSKPANIVGNTSFASVLASYQKQISGTGGIHKIGLTAGDYLANPVISRLPSNADSAPKPSSIEKNSDADLETNANIKDADTIAAPACMNSELASNISVSSSDLPVEKPPQSKPFRSHEADPIEQSIRKAAAKYNLPTALIKAVIKAESNFDAGAVSSAGARGLMQLMPATAEELGVTNSFDIDQNIDGGSHYLRKMLDKFGGNVRVALAAYNAGPGAVQKYNGNVPYPETRNYVKRVMRFSTMFG